MPMIRDDHPSRRASLQSPIAMSKCELGELYHHAKVSVRFSFDELVATALLIRQFLDPIFVLF